VLEDWHGMNIKLENIKNEKRMSGYLCYRLVSGRNTGRGLPTRFNGGGSGDEEFND